VKRYLVVVRLLHIREQQTLPFVLPFSFPFLGAVQHEVHEVETVVACGVVIGESFADWTRMERILVQTGHRPPPVTKWRKGIARRVEICGRHSSTTLKGWEDHLLAKGYCCGGSTCLLGALHVTSGQGSMKRLTVFSSMLCASLLNRRRAQIVDRECNGDFTDCRLVFPSAKPSSPSQSATICES